MAHPAVPWLPWSPLLIDLLMAGMATTSGPRLALVPPPTTPDFVASPNVTAPLAIVPPGFTAPVLGPPLPGTADPSAGAVLTRDPALVPVQPPIFVPTVVALGELASPMPAASGAVAASTLALGRCADGSCRADLARCPAPLVCPPGFTLCGVSPAGWALASVGAPECVPSAALCSASAPHCPADRPILCTDLSACVGTIEHCPTWATCPPEQVLPACLHTLSYPREK